MDTPTFTIRPGHDADAAGFIALIGACWAEYPSIVFDVDAELPELHALATCYAAKDGKLWAAEADGRVVGMIAVAPRDDGAWEICRLYVLASWRGAGLAHHLLDHAETHARNTANKHSHNSDKTRLLLWSDTRFDRAHRFYEKRGYVRAGPIRVLNDLSNSLEFGYAKPINGVAVLDAAAAASAERSLAQVLTACVAGGASVSFLPPLAPDVAHAFWRRQATEVATGGRVLIAGWADGALAGCVTLDLDTAPNQTQRAEVQMLLVHPAHRRRGLARALMQRLETEATQHGRTLLTLDTSAGDTAQALFHGMGWTAAGRIPGTTRSADGTLRDTEYFYKHITA